MSKKVYRYFYGLLVPQQKFLDRMAKEGWRLVKTGFLSYTFEPCNPDEYCYCIDFVAHLSARASADYQRFLSDMGYRVMTQAINANLSLGKVRIRPWGQGMGKIATNPGTFNKELLIVEKKNDGQPFELRTTLDDKINYYSIQRNMWATWALFFAAFAIYLLIRQEQLWKILLLCVLALFHGWATWQGHSILKKLKSQAEVMEA